ncbi:Endoplasmic reticulum protein [Operophtera brumata]|uniref:Endoplasmic reticulum transmembrane protein n=1 Tax=Operophtera brumata TaxID=104452 RepID=A0A0L7LTZ8_OPEBR|nr:Endoplasmic reticulum protein [Operophtera brumata]
MSIQWTFIAGYLYFEIALVIVMMLPLFSPRRWHQFFKSRLFDLFQQHAAMYFYCLLGVLCLFLIDAIREMRKYSHGSETAHIHLSTEMKGSVKLFRAQRNFYITGFSIFLAFVIRRLVTMLIIQDELSLKAERIIKEAEATVKLAKENILATTIQANEAIHFEQIKEQLEESLQKLKQEKKKSTELEEEAKKWKLMYEEIKAVNAAGKGDAL